VVVTLRGLVDLAEALVDRREAQPVLARQRGVAHALGDLAEDGVELVPSAGLLGERLKLGARLGVRRIVLERTRRSVERATRSPSFSDATRAALRSKPTRPFTSCSAFARISSAPMSFSQSRGSRRSPAGSPRPRRELRVRELRLEREARLVVA